MAIIFVLEPAPDVALVQIVVDMLSVVILVLALNTFAAGAEKGNPKPEKVAAEPA